MQTQPWDTESAAVDDALFEFDESTPQQRIMAAQALSLRLLQMSDSLRGRSDVDGKADRDYADCLSSRLNNHDPSIDDIWVAAALLREHERRTQRALAEAGFVSK